MLNVCMIFFSSNKHERMTSEQGQSGPASQPVSCLVLFTIQQAAVSPYLSPSPGQARDNCTAGQDFVKTVVLSGHLVFGMIADRSDPIRVLGTTTTTRAAHQLAEPSQGGRPTPLQHINTPSNNLTIEPASSSQQIGVYEIKFSSNHCGCCNDLGLGQLPPLAI